MTPAWASARWRSPAIRLGVVANLYLGLVALVLWAAMTMPEFGVTPLVERGGVAFIRDDGERVRVSPAAAVKVVSSVGALTLPAATFAADYMPHGDRAAVRRFFAERDQLRAIAAAPDARLIAGGRTWPLRERTRQLSDLPLDTWLLVLQAFAIGLLGAWIRLTAPPGAGTRMFALSCDGVLLAGLSGAVFDARALAADGGLLWAMQVLNIVGSNLCAWGLAALFLYLPRTLALRAIGPALLAFAVVLGVLQGLGVLPLSSFYSLLIVPNLFFLAAAVAQWRAARGDPKARTVIRLIGASSFAGAAWICCGMVVPVLFDLPSMGSDGSTILPIALVYGGIAFGVRRARLFELDAWSYRLALGAATLLLLLGVDALMVRVLSVERPVALAAALLVVGYAYLPLRTAAWRWVTGTRPVDQTALVRQAALAAFAADPEARRTGWRDLLDRVFAPLEIAAAAAVPDVRLAGGGESLHLPATADSEALLLRFARGGTRLFSAADVAVARELLVLTREAAEARRAYASGVAEERRRIARDLHDDVSGLLLTGLHRADVGAMRGDVRQALGEIRVMVSSMADGARSLADVLADIRHEAATRLAAAGLRLDWPPDTAVAPATLDYARARALISAVREVVTNSIKHSRAAALEVRAEPDPATLRLTLADRGEGQELFPEPGSGRGLANIAARLAEAGGRCEVEPAASGLTVRITLPLIGSGPSRE